MKILKSIILPAIAGALAGMFIFWAFDSFSQQGHAYFVSKFLESLTVSAIVVAIMNMSGRK